MTPLVIPFRTGRIIVLGDLHIDHYIRHKTDPFTAANLHVALNWDVDALIIAGDVADNWLLKWPPAIVFLKRFVPPNRLYVLVGNHDFYNRAIDDERSLQADVEAVGAHFVQKRELRHGASRILCCTLWTDFRLLNTPNESMAIADRFMMDYSAISKIDPTEQLPPLYPLSWTRRIRITPQDTLEIHRDHLAWLNRALRRPHFAGPAGKTIVVTHHGPHPIAAGPLDQFSPAFHSNLEPLIQRFQPDLWFFGHSHRRFRGQVGRTYIRNISIGYPFEGRFPGEAELDEMCVFESGDFEEQRDE